MNEIEILTDIRLKLIVAGVPDGILPGDVVTMRKKDLKDIFTPEELEYLQEFEVECDEKGCCSFTPFPGRK